MFTHRQRQSRSEPEAPATGSFGTRSASDGLIRNPERQRPAHSEPGAPATGITEFFNLRNRQSTSAPRAQQRNGKAVRVSRGPRLRRHNSQQAARPIRLSKGASTTKVTKVFAKNTKEACIGNPDRPRRAHSEPGAPATGKNGIRASHEFQIPDSKISNLREVIYPSTDS